MLTELETINNLVATFNTSTKPIDLEKMLQDVKNTINNFAEK
ncbi:hypothetical protein [Polaribacter ponticola]|uniref:Uncharacterized protein n=1 Tax=Polaribacter ponticola TaxID=2978475 RepID=A0ABT5SB69_9FLAO|nr:hypothetical protein [Polaribacter sp. MSW5]MDD7915357.1 hypothetical protein [Polaribacter sp. MSW5]